MTAATFSTSIEAQQAAALLDGYRFELGSHDARQWVSLWLESYRPVWIRDAVIEALYQGRYKSISVRQILELWSRRGQPIRHVTHEFEAAVCREFGETKLATSQRSPASRSPARNRRDRQNGIATSTSSDTSSNINLEASHAHPSSIRDSIRKASQVGLGPTAAVSFDLSATPPGIAKTPILEGVDSAALENESDSSSLAYGSTSSPTSSSEQAPNRRAISSTNELSTNQPLSSGGDEPYRRISRSAIQSPAETEALLRTQQQRNGVLYTSARAIQPFKPALPFSAQTLRLARQKAMA